MYILWLIFIHIIFIILIISIIWTDNDDNSTKYKYTNIINKIKGFNNYYTLCSNEILENRLKYYHNKNNCIIIFMANWCSNCKKIEKYIKDLSKKINVIKLDDKHPETYKYMFKFGLTNYPGILIYNEGVISKFDKIFSIENLLN